MFTSGDLASLGTLLDVGIPDPFKNPQFGSFEYDDSAQTLIETEGAGQ